MIDFTGYLLLGKHSGLFCTPSNFNWILPVNCLCALDIAVHNHKCWIIFGTNLVWQYSQPFIYQLIVLGYLSLCAETLKLGCTEELFFFFFLIACKVWFTTGFSLRKLLMQAVSDMTCCSGIYQSGMLWCLDDKISAIPTLLCHCVPALYSSALFTF